MSKKPQTRINQFIRAQEVRVLGPESENYGVLSIAEALKKAQEHGLDLIEISPNAEPPVTKIADFGRYSYDQNKKQKVIKAKAHTIEVKTIQVKVATGENDLQIKTKQASTWLSEGHRVRIELFLPGRSKYLDKDFLQSRLERALKFITVPHKIAETAKPGPKGISMIIEKA